MSRPHWVHRRFWFVYPAWIGLCALLFFLLQDVKDPSKPANRIPSDRAGEIALQILRDRDPEKYASYEVVNVAWSRPRETGPESRWVVLLDERVRSGLDRAIVVELEPRTGRLIRVRDVIRD